MVDQRRSSHLFHLEPIGISTPLVESLTSYLIRLAQAHVVPLGALVRYIADIQQATSSGEHLDTKKRRVASGFLRDAYLMNGVGTFAQTWIDMIGELTLRSNLFSLTTGAWAEVAHSRKLLCAQRRWCLTCITEWRVAGTPEYDPLLWHITEIAVCPIHRTPLEHQCPACRRSSPWLSWWSLSGRCAICYQSLVTPGADACECGNWNDSALEQRDCSKDANLNLQLQIARLIGEWLADTSGRTTSIPHEQLSRALRRILPKAEEGGAAGLARRLGVAKTTFWGWINADSPMALSTLVGICGQMGCSISEFFDDTAPVFQGNTYSQKSERSPGRLHHGRRDERRVAEIRESFARLLAANEKPKRARSRPSSATTQNGSLLTGQEAAAQLHVSQWLLRACAPDLYASLLARRRSERAERKQQRAETLATQVRQAALDIAATGEWPTARRVGDWLDKPGILRDKGAREALAAACVELATHPDQMHESYDN